MKVSSIKAACLPINFCSSTKSHTGGTPYVKVTKDIQLNSDKSLFFLLKIKKNVTISCEYKYFYFITIEGHVKK